MNKPQYVSSILNVLFILLLTLPSRAEEENVSRRGPMQLIIDLNELVDPNNKIDNHKIDELLKRLDLYASVKKGEKTIMTGTKNIPFDLVSLVFRKLHTKGFIVEDIELRETPLPPRE